MELDYIVDIGGTDIKFGICGVSSLQPCATIKTAPNREAILNDIESTIRSLEQQYQNTAKRILVSCPGMITKSGRVEKALYIDLSQVDLKAELEHRCQKSVVVENDANFQAYGRYNGNDNLLYLVIGTAVGGAYISENGIFKGNHGYACEFGHIFVNSNLTCYCGECGCLDTILSGKRITERFGDGWWKRDDNDIREYLQYCGQKTADAIISLTCLFDPGEVVICGHICKKIAFQNEVKNRCIQSAWMQARLEFESNTWSNVYKAACKMSNIFIKE